MRYRYFYGTFTRATSKSFLAIISQYLACMFLPRSKRFVVSQYKKASLSITKQKLEEIWTYWPILKNEILTLHMSNDYIEIIFKNQSVLQILSLTASSRGQRATGGRRSTMPPFLITKEVKKMVKLFDKQRWARLRSLTVKTCGHGRYVEYNVILNKVNIIKQAIPCQASIISKKV